MVPWLNMTGTGYGRTQGYVATDDVAWSDDVRKHMVDGGAPLLISLPLRCVFARLCDRR